MRFKPFCFVVLVSVLTALSSTSLAVAADATQRRIALGVSVQGGRQISRLDDFGESIGGRTPATWTIWSQWGNPDTSGFPTQLATRVTERGATPMIWWEPVDPEALSSPLYARHSNITAGKHDDYIRSFARDAKAFGSPVILRFAHEANGGYFPWGVKGFDNTASSFVEAWRHVHRIFDDVGAGNVRFLWSIAKKSCPGNCDPYSPFYPGDAFVDYMGFSSFNWGGDRKWVSMLKGFRRVTNKLAAISAKPIIAVEVASSASGGDKAAWIRTGYRAVHAELPRIAAIVYLDVDLRDDGHPDWRLSSPAAALRAYADIAARPEFRGRLPGT
jgi:hypothetical protein